MNPLHIHFADWCAGVIDGDGCFLLSKGGYPSCEITVGEGEEEILHQIKEVVGGSISPRISSKSYRWKIHHLRGVAHLLSLVHGRLRLAVRVEQCEKVAQCVARSPFLKKGGIDLSFLNPPKNTPPEAAPHSVKSSALPSPLEVEENGWLSGFFDAEGYFQVNRTTYQPSITLSQKREEILQLVKKGLGGRVYFDRSWEGYLYAASSAEDRERWFSYLDRYPPRSKKKWERYRQFKEYCRLLRRGDHPLKEGD